MLYAWNSVPLDGSDIYQPVVSIVREFLFTIYISSERSREVTSEGHQYLDNFEATYLLIFRQRKIFNIFVSERRHIHMNL